MANKIRVKAVEGRVARVSPKGEMIPHDRYILVDLTPYMARLINVHEDVTVEQTQPDQIRAKEKA